MYIVNLFYKKVFLGKMIAIEAPQVFCIKSTKVICFVFCFGKEKKGKKKEKRNQTNWNRQAWEASDKETQRRPKGEPCAISPD